MLRVRPGSVFQHLVGPLFADASASCYILQHSGCCKLQQEAGRELISAAQLRAARGFLGWSQSDLAKAAGVSRATIARAELAEISADTIATIRKALEKAGVIFVDENGEGPGVRLRKAARRKG